MDKTTLVKQYYKNLVDSLALAENILTTLDGARQSSMKLDYTSLDKENQNLLISSAKLDKFHTQRRQIAEQLGCKSERFTKEVLEKVSGNAKQTLSLTSEKLQKALTDCQAKLESQAELLLEQQNVLHEASQTLRVEVNA